MRWSGSDRAKRGPWVLLAALVIAGMAGARVAVMRADTQSHADCAHSFVSVAGDSLFRLPSTQRLAQPLAEVGNFAACSLGTRFVSYAWPAIDVVEWDAAGLAPDPTTIALRTRRFNPSSFALYRLATAFSPPVVTRTLSGLADARTSPPAIVLRHDVNSTNDLWLQHAVDGAPQIPVALSGTSGQPLSPLPGPHPILAQNLCALSSEVEDFRVLQAVMTTDQLIPASADEFAQRFRVPRPVTMSWAEIANGVSAEVAQNGPAEVTLQEADGSGSPPVLLPTPLTRGVTSEFIPLGEQARWIPTFDFDAQVTLWPGRDYWLIVRQAPRWTMYTKTIAGTEPPEFTSAIGPLFRRPTDHDAWAMEPDRALCFRLIGTETAAIGVEPPPITAAFTLSARPNPSRGDVRLSWSGASGPVRVQVLDLGGRVVGEAAGAARDAREWIWDGRLRGGRRLASGVYLLRATDGAGQQATRRVVLFR